MIHTPSTPPLLKGWDTKLRKYWFKQFFLHTLSSSNLHIHYFVTLSSVRDYKTSFWRITQRDRFQNSITWFHTLNLHQRHRLICFELFSFLFISVAQLSLSNTSTQNCLKPHTGKFTFLLELLYTNLALVKTLVDVRSFSREC